MLWRMSADLNDKRIGIMGTARPFFAHPWPATRVSATNVLPRLSARAKIGCANCANRFPAVSAPPPARHHGSVDRRRALVAIGPAHVRRQSEGDLAVVVARRRAELEGLQALAAQFDVVHRLHALITPLDDAAGEGIGRPALAQPHVLGAPRPPPPVAGP